MKIPILSSYKICDPKEVIPVIQVDHRIIGTGKPGEKNRRIMELFKEYTEAYGLEKRAASA